MKLPEHAGADLIQKHGHTKALRVIQEVLVLANLQSTSSEIGYADAIYCYVKGYCDAKKLDALAPVVSIKIPLCRICGSLLRGEETTPHPDPYNSVICGDDDDVLQCRACNNDRAAMVRRMQHKG